MNQNSSDPVREYDEPEEASLRRGLAVLGVVILILVVSGFAVWYAVSRPGTDVNPPETNVKNGGLVSAANGGQITYKDPNGKEVKLIIPAGALAQDSKITISWIKSGAVTDLYQLKPEGLTLKKPVTFVIPYKETGLKKGETPQDIELELWFKDMYSDRELLDFSVDEKQKTLSAKINKF